jgi:2-hydroxy-6-oxonona-2,4-dienedioate hydrolase
MSQTELGEPDWAGDPATVVETVASASSRFETPCGSGTMVWRRWGRSKAGNPPLVLLHGGSGSWTHWIKVIPALSRVTEIWIPDLPGLGDSAMPAPPHVPASCGQAVSAGAQRLIGQGSFHLVAFSFGAHVGTFAAAYLGKRLASFTICGSAALGLPHNRLDFDKLRSTATPAEAALVHRTNLARLMFFDPRRIDDLAVYMQAENIRRARFKSRPFASTNEIPETLPHVTAELRAIWGAKDVLATPDVETRYGILRKHHPELQTRTIDDAGHWAAYEQPAAFIRAIVELTGLSGESG